MSHDRLGELVGVGVSVWLDTLSRELLESGSFAKLAAQAHVTGATSNPTIFERAICGSSFYDAQIAEAVSRGTDTPEELFLELAVEDVRRAAAVLYPSYDLSARAEGFISIQCTPDLAGDTDATVAQALDLWERIDAPNLMIKVAATDAGIEATEQLTAAGVNVNVTLLFGERRYAEAIGAYMRGLEERVGRGESLGGIRSVASFFVSRIDTKADSELEGSPLRGQIAIANARRAYVLFRESFASQRWQQLALAGAEPQRPLWASTGTKDASYRDVVYLEQLALPRSVLTVPQAALEAFADHGEPARTRPLGRDSERILDAFGQERLERITRQLERDGVEAFLDSYRGLLRCIEDRVGIIRGGSELGAAA